MSNPSVQLSSKFFDNNLVKSYFHAPAATSAQIVTPDCGTTKKIVDMQIFQGFAAIAETILLVGNGITLMEIIASDDAAMTVNVEQIKTSGAIGTNVIGSKVVLECTAEEVSGAGNPQGFKPRYVAVRLTLQNAGDKCAVTYILTEPRFHSSLMTSNSVAVAD
jgi:hypothetical protein